MFTKSAIRLVALLALLLGVIANAGAEPPRHNNLQRAGAPVSATAVHPQNPGMSQRGTDTARKGEGNQNNGGWVVTPRPEVLGGGYDVTKGEHMVHMPDEKSARKAARALKHAQKKEDKSNDSGLSNGSGYRDDGSGNCGSTVLC